MARLLCQQSETQRFYDRRRKAANIHIREAGTSEKLIHLWFIKIAAH